MAEIVINFKIEGGSGTIAPVEPTPEKNESSVDKKEVAKTAFRVQQAIDIGKQLGMQVVNGAIASHGSRTGNYVQQEQMQTAISFGSKVLSTAIAFAANPILGAVSLVGTGIGAAYDIANYRREVRWQNREAEQLRRRAGYNSNYNR